MLYPSSTQLNYWTYQPTLANECWWPHGPHFLYPPIVETPSFPEEFSVKAKRIPLYSPFLWRFSHSYTGWWFGCHFLFSHYNIGNFSSFQLTNSYFSEGWPNHQPVIFRCLIFMRGKFTGPVSERMWSCFWQTPSHLWHPSFQKRWNIPSQRHTLW